MADLTLQYGALSDLAIPLASTISGGTAISDPLQPGGMVDLLLEVVIAPGAQPSGNTQAVVYAASSIDGVNYSGLDDLRNAAWLGVVMLPSASPARSRAMSIAAAFDGVLPPFVRIIVHNDSGASFAAAGSSARILPVTFAVGD